MEWLFFIFFCSHDSSIFFFLLLLINRQWKQGQVVDIFQGDIIFRERMVMINKSTLIPYHDFLSGGHGSSLCHCAL